MHSRARKWGNSLGVRIPKRMAEQAGLADGVPIQVHVVKDSVVIRPLRTHRYRLEDLLAGITRANRHAAIDDGGPLGEEIW